MQERLPALPGWLVPYCDRYAGVMNTILEIDHVHGLLVNDVMPEVLSSTHIELDEWPQYGQLFVRNDGSFSYLPNRDFVGDDYFSYRLVQGARRSDPAQVLLKLKATEHRQGFAHLYPNPVRELLHVTASVPLNLIEVWDSYGRMLDSWEVGGSSFELQTGAYAPGYYLLRLHAGDQLITRKFIRIRD